MRGLQAKELKRLQNTLGIAQSELQKVQEQYAECNKYCAFLDSVTPPDFFQEQAERYEADWQVGVCQSLSAQHVVLCLEQQRQQPPSNVSSITPPSAFKSWASAGLVGQLPVS